MNTTVCGSAGMDYPCLEEADPFSSCPDPSLCNNSYTGNNIGLAFGLTIGAGLATTVGALLPFVPLVKRSNTQFLAVGLGLAAGVMLYVSFTEIWKKSRDNFCCVTPEHFDVAVTSCFFGGIVLTILLDLLVAGLQRLDCGCCGVRQLRGTCLLCCCGGRERGGASISATNPSLPLDKVDVHVDTNGHTSKLGNGTVATPPPALEPQTKVGSGPIEEERAEEPDIQGGMASGGDCASVSVASISASENTNNYATASVNELFSTSSLLRMNAVIPKTTTSPSLDEGVEAGEEDSGSHVSVTMEGVGNGTIKQRKTPYQEMVSRSSGEGEGDMSGIFLW